MKEFFCGGRRKVGFIALVMALACAGGWIRSFAVHDELTFRSDSHVTQHFISSQSRLAWVRMTIDNDMSYVETLYFATPAKEDCRWMETTQWNWRLVGFGVGRNISEGFPLHQDIWAVHYSSVTVPLTLLAAYLILWKPRKPPTASQSHA
jgi:hypothetical protein